jgi:DNA-binding response OmpR family regulator
MSRIVIIEEDKLMRGLLTEWLSAQGYAVRGCASSNGQAPDDADLVIVDVYMPRDEGAKRLRSVKRAYPGTPVIAISGQFRPGPLGSRATADALGVQQVIAKPFSRGDLLVAVDRLIRRTD